MDPFVSSASRQTIMKFGAALVLVSALAGCREELYDGLSQRDANEMTALLLSEGVSANRQEGKDGNFSVFVAEGDFAKAVYLVSERGLPRAQFDSMMDVINDDRLIASPSQERARLNYAIGQELSRTVSEIEGIVSARVHLATPSDDPLNRSDATSSASVAIHHDRNFSTAGLVPRIKLLVANAVDGLDYDRVSIALFPITRGEWQPQDAALVLGRDQATRFATPRNAQLAIALGVAFAAFALLAGFLLRPRKVKAEARANDGGFSDRYSRTRQQ